MDEYGIEQFTISDDELEQIKDILDRAESLYKSLSQDTTSIEKAKWIMDMQKAQPLLQNTFGSDTQEYYCPNCGFLLRKGNIKHQDRCCPMCGQVLGWEETEEEEEKNEY